MYRTYKLYKHYFSTSTIKAGFNKYSLKPDTPTYLKNARLIGATESHALPIKLDDSKNSIYNNKKDIKKICKLTDKKMQDMINFIA